MESFKKIAEAIQLRILRWRDYSGMIWVAPKCYHMQPYKREAEGNFTLHRGGGRSHVTRGARIGTMCPRAKDISTATRQAGKGKKHTLPYSL